jgi:hypothetical protein
MQALVFEPRRAFAELDARPRFWWPLLVLALATAAMSLWYMSVVDMEWMVFEQLQNSPLAQNSTDEEIARMAREAAAQRGFRTIIGTLFSGLAACVGLLIGALYLFLAGKVTGVDRGFRHWMAMSAWTSLPTALALVPAAFVLLSATTSQIPQEALQPLSFNELFFHRARGETGYLLFNLLNVFQMAALLLATIGVKAWSGRSWLFSAIFVTLPWLLAIGIWALIALR